MGDTTVRHATAADDAAAAEIDRLATADLRRVYRPTAAARGLRSEIERELTRLVALQSDRVVGVVEYRIASQHVSVLSLGVHPDFRGRGIATALVRHVEHIARDADCQRVQLYTVRETGNVPIFESMGFEVESEAPTDLFEPALLDAFGGVHDAG